jgi:hypothetical protein
VINWCRPASGRPPAPLRAGDLAFDLHMIVPVAWRAPAGRSWC